MSPFSHAFSFFISAMPRTLLILILLPFVALPAAAADDRDFFESRVRPLLIRHCIDCHGAEKQESGLRLDSREGWARGGDRGTAIRPGRPADSLLIKAVRHSDPELKMPPDERLSRADVEVLTTWIERGAWDPRTVSAASNGAVRLSPEDAAEFWSFRPISAPTIPDVNDKHWGRTPVDAFVLSRMNEHGLSPADDADRRTLIRRATFDLTGLPPTVDEIREFLNDGSPDAFEKVIDRLLDSRAYGERWGRHWLDVARYADTAGDGADYPVREAAMYRDWVIRAFNRDMPFDQFVQEQIAGDILARRDSINDPERYASQVTATGFLAIGKRYGYKASPDYQHLDFADAIDAMGRSLMGLSLGCARCHDHKYDPISAEDYYGLYGILQSTVWAFPGGEEQKRPAHFPSLVPPPQAAVMERAKADDLAHFDMRIRELRQSLAKLDVHWRAGGHDLDFESQKNGERPGDPWVSAGPATVTADAQSPYEHIHPKGQRGVRIGSGKPTDGLRYVFRDGLHASPDRQMHFTVDFRTASESVEPGAFRFYLGRGVVQSLALECSATSTEFAVRNGRAWEVVRTILPGQWYTLRITIDPATSSYSGVVGTPGDMTEFKNKATGPGWDGSVDCFICDAFGHVTGQACPRDLDNIGLQEEPFASPGELIVVREINEQDTEQKLAALKSKVEELTKQRATRASQPACDVAYGVSDGSAVNARVQLRGEPDRLGNEVPRRFPEVLGGDLLAENTAGSGRLELAHWITRPTNPLTARVFVNRVWLWHLGRGLVDTPSDFGSRGARPTHPQLLDWLAAKFMTSGWSVKSLHRLIMNSRTWQLASIADGADTGRDPENRWLSRYARRPLDAESIRDAMLALSGSLDRSVPKSHPFPPVDTWGFTIHKPFHAVYDSNHRSVYLMVQRNRRHPYLALFDAADPNQSVALRNPTTTPTQALYLMNSPFIHERAEGFAERLVAASGDLRTRVCLAFEMAHGRIPAEPELQDAVAFVAAYKDQLGPSGDEREQEHAAWSAFARVLLTGNAFLFLD